MTHQETIQINTNARGFTDISSEVRAVASRSSISTGLCHVFCRHTSASLIICENADPSVRHDLETYMSRIVRDGDPEYQHTAEGPDDMSAHIRTILTHTDLHIPIMNNELGLGTWQGIYVWEHRTSPHKRSIIVTLLG